MVSLSEAAARKVSDLLAQAEGASSEAGLRVGVRNGGCSGFQYALALDAPTPSDRVFDHHGFHVIVDQASLQYVAGAVVDYVENFEGSGFQVDNPNVVASCGCGSSFHVSDDDAPASAA